MPQKEKSVSVNEVPGLIGSTSGRHLEFFLFGASPPNLVEESRHYTPLEDLTC